MLVLLGLASMMMLALVIDPSSEDGEGEDDRPQQEDDGHREADGAEGEGALVSAT